MKNLIALIVIALFTTATFAQDSKMDSKVESKDTKMKHECYKMVDGALVHCMGEKTEPQKTNVTLKSGAVITPDGTLKGKDGKTTKLENGQCVTLMGSIGDCEKMHAGMKTEKPMEKTK